jgi:hypothetical protein
MNIAKQRDFLLKEIKVISPFNKFTIIDDDINSLEDIEEEWTGYITHPIFGTNEINISCYNPGTLDIEYDYDSEEDEINPIPEFKEYLNINNILFDYEFESEEGGEYDDYTSYFFKGIDIKYFKLK